MTSPATNNSDLHHETPSEEEARLIGEADTRMAEIERRVEALTNEGFGDALNGALAVLLDPAIPDYPEAQRLADIVTLCSGWLQAATSTERTPLVPNSDEASRQVPLAQEPLTTRLARLGSMMREDEHKALIAEAVEALHAAAALQTKTESQTERYRRHVLNFVGAPEGVDLDTVSIDKGYETPYRYSEYESGGGYPTLNVYWTETAPRQDQTPADADWDGLYRHHVEIVDEDVALCLESLNEE